MTTDGVELAVDDGSVSMDAGREISRTATLTLTPTLDMTATQVYELVSSPGVELIIRRGLIVDGQPEYVPLGVFSTDRAAINLESTGSVSWTGSDRSKKIGRNRFVDPYQIAASTSLATAGADLLRSRLNDVSTNFSNVSETVRVNVLFEAGANSNPWKNAEQLFSNYGYQLRFDGLGTATAIEVPDPALSPSVFDFGTGETSLILSGDSETTLENVYNGVIASAEGTEVATPVRAVVWDTDPTSPTYYLGGYGQKPYFFSSSLITTEDLATKAARTLLARVKGRSQQFSWPAIVNPALEPLDVVTVTFGDRIVRCVIDTLDIPLGPDKEMSAKARQTSIV